MTSSLEGLLQQKLFDCKRAFWGPPARDIAHDGGKGLDLHQATPGGQLCAGRSNDRDRIGNAVRLSPPGGYGEGMDEALSAERVMLSLSGMLKRFSYDAPAADCGALPRRIHALSTCRHAGACPAAPLLLWLQGEGPAFKRVGTIDRSHGRPLPAEMTGIGWHRVHRRN